MRVYIVRHGKAAERLDIEESGQDGPGGFRGAHGGDFARPLTARGVAQSQFLAQRIKTTERRLGHILVSPLVRAQETAKVIQGAMGTSMTTVTELATDHDVADAIRLIEDHKDDRAVMLVGHNPQLGELVSVLASHLEPRDMILKTGECVVMELRPNSPIGSAKIVERLRLEEDAAAAGSAN